jgi:hypothetical protein
LQFADLDRGRLVAASHLCYAAAESGLCRIVLPQDRNSATDPAVVHYQVLEHEEAIMGKGNNSQKKETKKPKKDASKKGKESKK